jgi:single-strand DNA-binding protein
MTKMRMATNHRWKDAASGESREVAEFHNVVVFGPLAEICASYGSKGRRLFVEGRLRTTSYDDRDGNKRYSTEVVAGNVVLLNRAPGQAESAETVEPALAVVS